MTKLVRWEENPDEIVLEEVEMFHLESMNERKPMGRDLHTEW
jgi:hypothetical protein